MVDLVWYTNSFEETEELAQGIAKVMSAGDILCLEGDLGAGKTTFARGFIRTLYPTPYVTSPTFTIVNEYDGILSVYHFDLYRVEEEEELFEIGFEEYFEKGGIVLIEWASRFIDNIPLEALWLTIEKTEDPNERKISLSAFSEKAVVKANAVWKSVLKGDTV